MKSRINKVPDNWDRMTEEEKISFLEGGTE